MVRIWDGSSSNRFLLPGCWNVILATTLLVVVVTQIHPVQSISNEEKAALAEILTGHPDLSSVPSWRQLTDDGTYYGRSWPSDTSDVCSRDGYDIYGVFCLGGSVVGLRITEAFGVPALSSFPAVSGLVNLKNLTLEVTAYLYSNDQFSAPLINSIAQQSIPLQHLRLHNSYRWNGILPSSLVYLSLGWINGPVSLSDFPNLRYLKLTSQDATLLDSLHASLEELHFSSSDASYQTVFSKLGNFPALTVLECDCSSSHEGPPALNSDQLKSLTLSPNYNSFPPVVSGKNLEVLEAYRAKVTLGALPSLKYLSCASFSSQTGTLPHNLQTLVLVGNDWNLESLEAVACPLIRSSISSLESLTIFTTSYPISVVPTCITEPQLKYLELRSLKLADSLFATTFQASLPLSLTGLSLALCPNGLSLNAFTRLRNLETLDVFSYYSWADEITPDFITFTKNLRTLKLNSGGIRGRITTIGGPKLEVLELSTGITVWDGLESSPNLKILRMDASYLQSLPSDDVFLGANLASLKVFEFRSQRARGPIPTFWVNLATLSSVSISGNYSGPLPNELALPRLQNLEIRNIVTPDRICGSLPNFLVPTHLKSLILHSNSISGTIPASWEQNLTILEKIELQNTLISGTIPQHLFDHHAIQLLQIQFYNTFIGGSLWDSVRGMPQQMDFTNTLLSLSCPPLPSPSLGLSTARFVNISSCPQDSACVQAWEASANSFSCSIQTDRVLPQIGSCNLVPRCPTPAPPNPFVCNDGAWVLEDIITNWNDLSLAGNLGLVTIDQIFGVPMITFSGPSTTLWLPKCLSSLNRVILEIDPESDIPAGNVTLIQQGPDCRRVNLKRPLLEVVSMNPNSNAIITFSTESSTSTTLSYSYTIEYPVPLEPTPTSQTPSNQPSNPSQVPSLEPTTNSSLVNHASQLALSIATVVAVSMMALFI